MCDRACRVSAYARSGVHAGIDRIDTVRLVAGRIAAHECIARLTGNPCSGYNNAYAISAEPKRKRGRVLSDGTRTLRWIASLLNPGRASDLLARRPEGCAAAAKPNSPMSRTRQNRPRMSVVGRCPKNDGQVIISGGPSAGWHCLVQRHGYAYPARDLLRQFDQQGISSASRSSEVIDQPLNPNGDKRRLCFMTAARRRCPF